MSKDVSFLLDKWIELAVANEVVVTWSSPSAYTLRFHSLKKLEPISVHIDEQMVQKFISECFLLEDLFLSLCLHCKRIRISHVPKLKILTIDTFSSGLCDSDSIVCDVESIEIVAPSLQQCTLIDVDRSCVIDMVGCADLSYSKFAFYTLALHEDEKRCKNVATVTESSVGSIT
ncbi:hypothetical protein Dsin_022701 [Dipteronia sinensis]|uniref:F-box/LRR-repeat protein 15/At3g58940/PEG3-like LRR domain-containing protein n=1 Tax=Dipteronia sinensis TaxID=43782 RepID=A0AAE0E067_9ROSI|nr:hypothetical protein Dsin_022701 [Dipteronia sinensis]